MLMISTEMCQLSNGNRLSLVNRSFSSVNRETRTPIGEGEEKRCWDKHSGSESRGERNRGRSEPRKRRESKLKEGSNRRRRVKEEVRNKDLR
jgi:hypothetical protein